MNETVTSEAGEAGEAGEVGSVVGNLADAVGTSNSNPAEGQGGDGTTSSSDWFISEGVKGEGDKPDFFDDKKYKSIYDQALKAGENATEMRKKLGAFTGSPDEYSLELTGDLKDVKLDSEDPLLKDFTALAKNSKMSQEGYTKTLEMFANYSQLQAQRETDEITNFQKAELETLGGPEKAREQINEMCQWFSQNFPTHEPQDFKDMMYFAEGFKILKSMREKMGYAKTPEYAHVDNTINKSELSALLDDPKYLNDPAYQAMVNAKYQRAYGKK
jgi:hypothetical protein